MKEKLSLREYLKKPREGTMASIIIGSAIAVSAIVVFSIGVSVGNWENDQTNSYEEIDHQSLMVYKSIQELRDSDAPDEEKATLLSDEARYLGDLVECYKKDIHSTCENERVKLDMQLGVTDAYIQKSSNPDFSEFEISPEEEKELTDELINNYSNKGDDDQ